MSEASQMSDQATLLDTRSAISSQESGAGPTLFDLLNGPMIAPSGLGAARANRSPSPERDEEKQTSVTYGQSSDASSRSAALQLSLESRLRARLAEGGSPEYALTWKHWDMESGPQICALRASGRRTSGSGSTGWQTPDATPREHSEESLARKLEHRIKKYNKHSVPLYLSDQAALAGWPTPTGAPDTPESHGQSSGRGLRDLMAGWPTPMVINNTSQKAQTGRPTSGPQRGGPSFGLGDVAKTAGWPTPNAMEGGQTSRGGDRKDEKLLGGLVRGLEQSSSLALTGKRGALNPALSRWLMGYPAEWGSCGATAMQLCRSAHKRS